MQSKSRYLLYCSCPICRKLTTVQNLQYHKHVPPKNICKKCHRPTDNPFYCSRICFNSDRPKKKIVQKKNKQEKLRERFLSGKIKERSSLRRYLIELNGNKCNICNLINSWQGEPLTLIVDHKDGDASNNHPNNLRLLCPNCNSQTPTFGGRNKGKGRRSRGLPLY